MNSLLHNLKALLPKNIRTGVKYSLLKVKYAGNAYQCPVCGSGTRLQKELGFDLAVIREKKIVGAGVRNTLCPVCLASDRIRLLYLYLTDRTNIFRDPLRLLHFAPEPSLEYILRKHKNIDYLTADLYQDGVMEKIDITNIPYPDHSFDAILCNHVLEHIPDDRLAMSELYRVLSPGGWAILQVPFSQVLESTYENPDIITREDRELHFGHWDHVRIYGLDYPARLEATGFEVETFSWVRDPDPVFHQPKLNLNPEELVFFCRRP